MFSRSTPASSFPASKNPLVFTSGNTNHYKITWLSCLLCSRECHICCSDALKGSSSLPSVTHFYTTFHVLGYSLISSAEKWDTQQVDESEYLSELHFIISCCMVMLLRKPEHSQSMSCHHEELALCKQKGLIEQSCHKGLLVSSENNTMSGLSSLQTDETRQQNLYQPSFLHLIHDGD